LLAALEDSPTRLKIASNAGLKSVKPLDYSKAQGSLGFAIPSRRRMFDLRSVGVMGLIATANAVTDLSQYVNVLSVFIYSFVDSYQKLTCLSAWALQKEVIDFQESLQHHLPW
jgi:hypothetical protein